jgi:hypothetical protein
MWGSVGGDLVVGTTFVECLISPLAASTKVLPLKIRWKISDENGTGPLFWAWKEAEESYNLTNSWRAVVYCTFVDKIASA